MAGGRMGLASFQTVGEIFVVIISTLMSTKESQF